MVRLSGEYHEEYALYKRKNCVEGLIQGGTDVRG